MKRCLAILFAICMPFSASAVDNTGREFMMSTTYGVLAGTLVGAASLAFTHKPGDNLNKVARGASLGLYAGILLGAYVVYVVPSLESSEEEDPTVGKIPPFLLSPMFTAKYQIDGARADWKILSF